MTPAAPAPLPARPPVAAGPEEVGQWLEAADRVNAELCAAVTAQAELIRALKRQNAEIRTGHREGSLVR